VCAKTKTSSSGHNFTLVPVLSLLFLGEWHCMRCELLAVLTRYPACTLVFSLTHALCVCSLSSVAHTAHRMNAAMRAATAKASKLTLNSLLREAAIGTGLGMVVGAAWYAGFTRSGDRQIVKYYAEHGEQKP
jgi:hypothetical protein